MAKSKTAVVAEAGDEHALYLELYRKMVLIRRFEEAVYDLFLRGQVYGSTHLCIGQEAVGPGVTSALRKGDMVASTYRGHGNVLGLGCDSEAFMAELLGRATGICGGRAGSMNVVDVERGLIGCFGIVGGSLAAATGAALGLRTRGGVAVAFFGDGTANQAYFHECLNFAKVLSLPVVYVCENNQYSEYTPVDEVTPGGILARPRAMEIPAERVDGQDVLEMRAAALEAIARARGGDGPQFIEAFTYRYSDHGRGDPVQYRPEGEMERWKERDPLIVGRARLTGDHGIANEAIDAMVADAEEEVRRITAAALAAPFPDPELDNAAEFAPAEVA
jgi:TPP-dependent pyruvate/acetoin dehydrogenase alpha subunit